MLTSTHRAATSADTPPDLVRAAFRDLHGTRLHGFALLVALGDRARAARLTADALAAGEARATELRHPERAAAWLRRRVMRAAERADRGHQRLPSADDRLALDELGVDRAALAGLTALTTRERAALVADSVERLDRGDVASVVGVNGARLDRLIHRVRASYAATAAEALGNTGTLSGPTAARIRAVARRALT